MVPGRVVDADADEPAEQKVVLQPFHQKPFGADRVEGLQQHCPQKLLRRDRWSSDRRIQRCEFLLQRRKRLVHDPPDRAQRMIAPNPRLEVHIAEQFASSIVAAAHEFTLRILERRVNHRASPAASPFFNSLLDDR